MSLHSLVHPVAVFSSRGLPAGDIFNDIFVKIYCVGAYDSYTKLHKEVRLAVYVDDNTITYQGPVDTVATVISNAGRDLLNTLRGE
eukprot:12727078-Prorocentrum_lima.AAC.1